MWNIGKAESSSINQQDKTPRIQLKFMQNYEDASSWCYKENRNNIFAPQSRKGWLLTFFAMYEVSGLKQ